MTLDTKRLKEIAEKATKGEWFCDYNQPYGAGGAVCRSGSIRTDDWQQEIVRQPNNWTKKNGEQVWANGNFIAAFNPAVVLELLAEVEEQCQTDCYCDEGDCIYCELKAKIKEARNG